MAHVCMYVVIYYYLLENIGLYIGFSTSIRKEKTLRKIDTRQTHGRKDSRNEW